MSRDDVAFTARMPIEQAELLKLAADILGITEAGFIRGAVEQRLDTLRENPDFQQAKSEWWAKRSAANLRLLKGAKPQ